MQKPLMALIQMKTALYAIAGVILLLGQAAVAQIAGRPYLAADAGVSFLEGTTAHATWFSRPVSAKIEFDPGYRADLRLGYFVPQGAAINFRGAEAICNFAFEFNTGLLFNPVSTGPAANIDFYQVPLLINAIVLLPLTERLSLSLGLGAGGALTMLDLDNRLGQSTSTDVGFAYQGLVRISYQLNPHLSVHAFSNVMGSPQTSFPDEPFRGAGLEPLKMDGPLSISGGLGITYLF